MKEFEQILALWSQLQAKGESAVLATVAKTSGSSYRLPGARLLLSRTGQRVGSVSGGCLEDDLVKKAWWLTENGPIVRRYDTTPDGEIAAEYGLGCNGIIHVLLERLTPGYAEILELIRQVRETRLPATVVHVLTPASGIGQRLIIQPDGSVRHNVGPDVNVDAIRALAQTVPDGGKSRLVRTEDGVELFIESVTPELRLLVFGAGDDAIPLVTLAKFLGWQVVVYDGRSHYARKEKFPGADDVIVRSPGDLGSHLPADDWTAAVLMSHSYSQDLEMLKELAGRKLRYLGVLGPRKRAMQMLNEAGLEHEIESPWFRAPMGLDIGADGPEQVALAVVAEIQATLNGRLGGRLRDRVGSIHAEASESVDGAADNAWVRSIICA